MICPCCKKDTPRDEVESAQVEMMSEKLTITEAWNPYKSAVVCPNCGVIYIERTK